MSTANNTDIESLLTPNHIDMSQLPAPTIIEQLSFEDIFEELLVDFKAKDPTYDALVESDPVIIALECAAYREMLLRNKINEAAKACMLAYATGTDLDNHAAFYGIGAYTAAILTTTYDVPFLIAFVAAAIVSGRDLAADEVLNKHAQWVDELKARYAFTEDNAMEILMQETGKVFAAVLEDAGVYKNTPDGKAAFREFVDCVNQKTGK